MNSIFGSFEEDNYAGFALEESKPIRESLSTISPTHGRVKKESYPSSTSKKSSKSHVDTPYRSALKDPLNIAKPFTPKKVSIKDFVLDRPSHWKSDPIKLKVRADHHVREKRREMSAQKMSSSQLLQTHPMNSDDNSSMHAKMVSFKPPWLIEKAIQLQTDVQPEMAVDEYNDDIMQDTVNQMPVPQMTMASPDIPTYHETMDAFSSSAYQMTSPTRRVDASTISPMSKLPKPRPGMKY